MTSANMGLGSKWGDLDYNCQGWQVLVDYELYKKSICSFCVFQNGVWLSKTTFMYL